ncbi:MAG: heavy metal translocating P-type ATPase, partial [Saprospiraceae bacterium]
GRPGIDVPIALGMLTLWLRSSYEIITHTGTGYLDSLAGFIFFLLIGKWFQQQTYYHLSFDRDYRSYFPIAVRRLLADKEERSIGLHQLKTGDQLVIRHGELIPADGVLQAGDGQIDYSFVTGEERTVSRKENQQVFAGGRQMGGKIVIQTTKSVDQSYLTQLWKDTAFTAPEITRFTSLTHQIGQYFTVAIITIAVLSFLYWLPDMAKAVNVATAVLIVACPCALALTVPFTIGNALRLLAKAGFYLKETTVAERLARINAVVFDKTGTLTSRQRATVKYDGTPLTDLQKQLIHQLTDQSTHPVSQLIHQATAQSDENLTTRLIKFTEITGRGITGIFKVAGQSIQLSIGHLDANKKSHTAITPIIWNGKQVGGYQVQHAYRNGIAAVFAWCRKRAKIFLVSGDDDRERDRFATHFATDEMQFRQKPAAKLDFVRELQTQYRVLMIGDGLNDAGALKQSDVGIVLTEDTTQFTPAADAILQADKFAELPLYLNYINNCIRLVYASFGLAFIYNVVGLFFAVQGLLTPIVAAILMPLSSISIITFGTISSTILWKTLKKDSNYINK